MSVINIDDFSFDNSYPDLQSAIEAAQDSDEIRLFKDVTINSGIKIDAKNLLINGNHHKIVVEIDMKKNSYQIALALYNGSLKVSNLDVEIERNEIFIAQVSNLANLLILENVTVTHRSYDKDNHIKFSVGSAHYKKIKGKIYANPIQTTELHNCNLDCVKFVNNRLTIDDTFIGNSQYSSLLTGHYVSVNNSTLNSIYISSIKTENTVKLNNIQSSGGIIVSGNLSLDGFKLLPLKSSSGGKKFALMITTDRQKFYESNFEQPFNQALKATAEISNLDFSAQQDNGVSSWFSIKNSDVTFNNTLIPETLRAPNLIENSQIHLNNTKDLSKWQRIGSSKENDHSNNKSDEKLTDKKDVAKPADQPAQKAPVDPNDAIAKLDQLVGLANVKRQVREFIDVSNNNLRRKKRGLKVNSISMNMLFEGNPGTGKTVVARLVGEAMFQKGILKGQENKDGSHVAKFKEVQVQDLVDNIIGGTAMKTEKVIKSALDGVLFIDEAYSLAPVDGGGNGDQFKNEAVNTLIAQMENNRERLVVIMAGYTKQMEDFMKKGNPGLKSRFTNKIIFPDYSADELIQILKLDFQSSDYVYDPKAFQLIADRIREVYPDKGSSGNARFIRNVFDDLIKQQSTRLAPIDDAKLTDDDLKTITMDDIQKTIKYSEHLKVDEINKKPKAPSEPQAKPVHNNPASANDPRNAIIKESKNPVLHVLYKYHQIMDDLAADYDARTNAVLEILSMKSNIENQLDSFDANDVERAKLLLPFFAAFDADVDYKDLNQQLEQLNDKR